MKDHDNSMESLLNETKNNISNLKIQVDNLPEVIKLRRLEQEENELEKRVINCFLYDIKVIGKILVKLMSIFEGVEYCLDNSPDLIYDYYLHPKECDNKYKYIYSRLGIIKIRNIINEEKEICYLPSSNIKIKNKYQKYETIIKTTYIQKFINYLNEQRFINDNKSIDEEFFEKCLQDFIDSSKELQIERTKEIKRAVIMQRGREERKKFEDTCFIERTIIYDALSYIINNYEDDLIASQTIDEISENWIVTEAYHILTIKRNNSAIAYRTEISPNNHKQETQIPFFNFKKTFEPLLDDTSHTITFLNSIEKMFYDGKKVTKEDIEIISNSINKNSIKIKK